MLTPGAEAASNRADMDCSSPPPLSLTARAQTSDRLAESRSRGSCARRIRQHRRAAGWPHLVVPAGAAASARVRADGGRREAAAQDAGGAQPRRVAEREGAKRLERLEREHDDSGLLIGDEDKAPAAAGKGRGDGKVCRKGEEVGANHATRIDAPVLVAAPLTPRVRLSIEREALKAVVARVGDKSSAGSSSVAPAAIARPFGYWKQPASRPFDPNAKSGVSSGSGSGPSEALVTGGTTVLMTTMR